MKATAQRPNILLILNDDMGYSDIGCYGGEVETPNLDRLARGGLRYTQFYNTARCCPSRASLLTGHYPHQADVGHMIGDDQMDGYLGDLSQNSATIAEALKLNGYRCYMSGKWHVTGKLEQPNSSWPCQRGFDKFYGVLNGAGSFYSPKTLTRDNDPLPEPEGDYYFTDAITDEAIQQLETHFQEEKSKPFFHYLAYTAPHWPLHAPEETIAKYKGRFDEGWDKLREKRLKRLRQLGILGEESQLSAKEQGLPDWDATPNKDWECRRMEVYAAQIDRMDQGIGRVIETLEAAGQLDNTLILFLSDNGGCHEDIKGEWARRMQNSPSARKHTRDGRPVRFGNEVDYLAGPEDTFMSYGPSWANLSNTPFRKFKCWVHEGGIATPLIVHWPQGIQERDALRRQPAQLPDLMATFLDVSGSEYPKTIGERSILPHEGYSLVPTFEDQPHAREVLYWEHEGNCGIRRGRWKLVCTNENYLHSTKDNSFDALVWELYDIDVDRSELNDLSAEQPEIVQELTELWLAWARRCHVAPFRQILDRRGQG
ncbi:MAG: arylsulfatase [Opitutales bacterium]